MANSTTKKPDLRQQVRNVGQNGNYWYAVELSKNLKKGESKEVIYWKSSIAIYRGEDGNVRGLENRCAHRQLRLSKGIVEGNNIICQYHGWTYDECGKCVAISHEIGSSKSDKLPKIVVQSFPVREKYGLIWLFPGDPARAESTEIPLIPQLELDKPWKFIPIDITINAHFSMVLENVCDFNHAFLHRKYKPFTDPHLTGFDREGDVITMNYETDLSQSQVVKIAGERQGKDFDDMTLWYNYPFQASNIADKYLHSLFMVPIDERTTRCFFLFLFGSLEIPFVRWQIPRFVRIPLIKLINKFYVLPLLSEDLWALEEEQHGHDIYPDAHHYEFNPIVKAFQKMTLEKWQQYLGSEVERQQQYKDSNRRDFFPGAGLTRLDLEEYKARRAEAVEHAAAKVDEAAV